jgi:hypothetical protein
MQYSFQLGDKKSARRSELSCVVLNIFANITK